MWFEFKMNCIAFHFALVILILYHCICFKGEIVCEGDVDVDNERKIRALRVTRHETILGERKYFMRSPFTSLRNFSFYFLYLSSVSLSLSLPSPFPFVVAVFITNSTHVCRRCHELSTFLFFYITFTLSLTTSVHVLYFYFLFFSTSCFLLFTILSALSGMKYFRGILNWEFLNNGNKLHLC